jgi:anti-sigma factor RsiW
MAANEDQLERLETYLDGALSPDEVAALRGRLEREPFLTAALDQLRAERAVRVSAFATMEGDDALAGRLISQARSRVPEAPGRGRWGAALRYVVAAAACLCIGFVAGQLIEKLNHTTLPFTPVSQESSYRVAITDDAGRVIAIQKFESMDEATEFSEDLRRWQERQEQIRNGQITVRSASF